MDLIGILFGLYAIASAGALAFLWRRVDRLGRELAVLRRDETAARPHVVGLNRPSSVVPIAEDEPVEAGGPAERAARTWRLREYAARDRADAALSRAVLQPDTLRGLLLGMLATAPAVGFFFAADPSVVVACGLAVAAAMMVVALQPVWSVAAWASVSTAVAWSALGFALGAAHADQASYAACIALAGLCGLVAARVRRAPAGGTLALAMAAAALALASQTGMIGPAGAAYGALVAAAAIVGASSLRLEVMHLAAFAAAVIGLFVLSGQASAAVWFTPVTSWAGALFLGIAAVRVPHLGARGLAIAGTGGFGALGALLALNSAQHGLADRFAAAGALVALSAILAAIIVAAAMHRGRGLQGLRFSLWMLVSAAMGALAAATVLALPAPLAAISAASIALGLMALNARFPDGVWRTFAGATALFTLPFAVASAQIVLNEASGWPGWLPIVLGVCCPAVALGFAAHLAGRQQATKLAALCEFLTIVLAIAGASLFVRLIFSGGALRLYQMGFVEAGVHAAVWLLAALLIGARAHEGARRMRIAAVNLLLLAAAAAVAAAGAYWVAEDWTAAGRGLVLRDTLGFLLPGLAFMAHWVFWRARADEAQTRLAFGVGMLLIAAFLAVEALWATNLPDWARSLAGALSFAVALGLNFAPGVANSDGVRQRSQFRKNLDRDVRREQRRKARQHAR